MWHFIRRQFDKLWSRIVYDISDICVYGITPEQYQPRDDALEIERADAAQLQQLAGHWDYFAHRQTLSRQRIRAGDRCFLAFQDQQLVHVIWARISKEIDISYELGPKGIIPLQSAELILYDAWTPEAMRGHGFYARTMTKILPQCFTISPRVWIYSLSDNLASRRGIEKCGFRLHHRLQRVRWFGLSDNLSHSPLGHEA